MKMEQSVPKRRLINSRRRVITQKKAYKHNVLFVWGNDKSGGPGIVVGIETAYRMDGPGI